MNNPSLSYDSPALPIGSRPAFARLYLILIGAFALATVLASLAR